MNISEGMERKGLTLAALRKRLSGRLREDDLHEINYYAQGIEDNPVKLALYRLLFDADKRVSDNAAWVFTHFDLHTNEWLYPKRNELIDEAMRTDSDTKRRLLLNLLLRQPCDEENARADFLDFCVERMSAVSEQTSVRVLCMKLAYEQCRPFPELLTELQSVLEIMEPDLLPSGLRTARKNVLGTIRKRLSL